MLRRKREWAEWEIDFLKEFFFVRTNDDLAKVFKCSAPTVSAKARELGLGEKNRGGVNRMTYVWSDEDVEYLKGHFPYEPASDIADVIGISYPCVLKKARELGLKKSEGYDPRRFNNRYVGGYKHRSGISLDEHLKDVA